ncbi:nucleotidyltransferase family protein [Achromobacter sp.]|uniref:nucleotidyltransferase family protein n=1 Tax=Achromobacter sp. TaxID=134375 RepID=UPI00338D97C9
MTNPQTSDERRLCELVENSALLMGALRSVRSLGLSSWCIGAGVVRSLVWDALHGFQEPSAVDDVDVVYFDADAEPRQDKELQERLSFLDSRFSWDVTNQARVHEWLVDESGLPVSPLGSLEEGISTWPEYATCVGVYLEADASVKIIAPHGLSDLFELVVRHNPLRASAATFMQRVNAKRFSERWPQLSICLQ